MGNMYFKHKYIHNHARASGGRDGMEAIDMSDLVLRKRDMLCV